MKAIVSVSPDWGIGLNGQLLAPIPEDLKRFREITLGKVVVMGRTTLLSLPRSSPLPKRTNIVLSRSHGFKVEGTAVCAGLKELGLELRKYPSDEVYVIGGESVYRLLLPYCDEALVTKHDSPVKADTYFPDLDKTEGWSIAECSEVMKSGETSYRYIRYINSSVLFM
ncbi:MAG: dihydrofolate reductase [Eubacteriales bacterium]